jgi:hypothetical protein
MLCTACFLPILLGAAWDSPGGRRAVSESAALASCAAAAAAATACGVASTGSVGEGLYMAWYGNAYALEYFAAAAAASAATLAAAAAVAGLRGPCSAEAELAATAGAPAPPRTDAEAPAQPQRPAAEALPAAARCGGRGAAGGGAGWPRQGGGEVEDRTVLLLAQGE